MYKKFRVIDIGDLMKFSNNLSMPNMDACIFHDVDKKICLIHENECITRAKEKHYSIESISCAFISLINAGIIDNTLEPGKFKRGLLLNFLGWKYLAMGR